MVNGSLPGFEIKRGRDSLRRLARQVPCYDRIFDYSPVVVAARHAPNVSNAVPSYWGIRIVQSETGGIYVSRAGAYGE
jgi:hypothetical protein